MSEEKLVKQLLTSSRCEVCGQNFEEGSINILGHSDAMWVVHICCGACYSRSLLVAIIDDNEDCSSMQSAEITDLTSDEIENYNDVIITADDVLDMHNYLAEYNSGFSQLLE